MIDILLVYLGLLAIIPVIIIALTAAVAGAIELGVLIKKTFHKK